MQILAKVFLLLMLIFVPSSLQVKSNEIFAIIYFLHFTHPHINRQNKNSLFFPQCKVFGFGYGFGTTTVINTNTGGTNNNNNNNNN